MKQEIEDPLFLPGEYDLRWSRFLDQIIDFFAHEGYIESSRLFESPFSDIIDGGISGAFDQDTSMKIIQMILGVNENALIQAQLANFD